MPSWARATLDQLDELVDVEQITTAPGVDPVHRLLPHIDRRGVTSTRLAEVAGLDTRAVAEALAPLLAAGLIERGRDNRWRSAA